MLKINAGRLQQHFEAMSLIGKIGETGTCRPTLTPLEKQGFELAASWMQEASPFQVTCMGWMVMAISANIPMQKFMHCRRSMDMSIFQHANASLRSAND